MNDECAAADTATRPYTPRLVVVVMNHSIVTNTIIGRCVTVTVAGATPPRRGHHTTIVDYHMQCWDVLLSTLMMEVLDPIVGMWLLRDGGDEDEFALIVMW
eukprot:scaffold445936_cov126-Attheya_sp.AAC.2